METYENYIQNILNTRGRFACGEEYHERHHILPRCMDGGDEEENLIDLFAREHFIAHKMLAQENPHNDGLVYAWNCMAFARNSYRKRYELTPEEYEEVKTAYAAMLKAKNSIPVVQLDLFGNYIAKYNSCLEVEETIGIDSRYVIDCKNHKRGHACGFMFISEDEYDPHKDYKYKFPGREVVQFNIDGDYIQTFINPPAAAQKTGINVVSIRGCCIDLGSTSGGYRWMFLDEWDGGKLAPIKYDYKNKKIITETKRETISVNRYDNIGRYICTYESINDAAFDVGCAGTNISYCCRNTYSTIMNCYWRYTNQVDEYNDIMIETIKYNQHKPVIQLSLAGKFVAIYNSMKEAEEKTGISAGCISGCCRGTQNSAGCYLWILASEYYKGNIPIYNPRETVAVVQLNSNGIFVAKYDSIKEAQDVTGTKSCNIITCCKKPGSSANGFQWVYEKDYDSKKIYQQIKIHERKVVKLTINGDYIAIFNSVTDAAASVGKKTPAIIRNCKNQHLTAYGFKWIYLEDYAAKNNLKNN